MKNNLFIILFFLFQPLFLFSQQEKMKKIDEYIKKGKEAKGNMDFEGYLEYAKKANVLALQIDNSEKIAWSYLHMAVALGTLEFTKESLLYTEKALQQKFAQHDRTIKAISYTQNSINYITLDLYDNVIEECDKIISIVPPSESDLRLVENLANAYYFKGYAYKKKGNPDSLAKYFRMELNLLKSKPEKSVFIPLSSAYAHLGQMKKGDSSVYYIEKAISLRKKYDPDYPTFDFYSFLGEYYYDNAEDEKALENFLIAYHELKARNIKFYGSSLIYKKISELYEKLGDAEKEKEFLQMYVQENERLQKDKERSMVQALAIIGEEREKKFGIFTNKIYIAVAVLTALISLLLIYLLNKQKRKKKLIQEQEAIISEKEEETQILHKKVNESFEEVIELAKSNSPEFFTRFREVYPELIVKLLEINSKFRISELTLCAYIFLGFNTKDIATYTFTSVNTVKARKYNLRKKLSIPAESTTEMWIRNIRGKS